MVLFFAAITGFLLAKYQLETDNNPASQPKSKNTVALRQTLTTIGVWLFIWLAPLFFIYIIFGWDNVFTQLGYFFSKLAVVTFGGAYSVLAYMAQEVVQNYSWLTAQEMLDGLGLAETTNGPLILVNEFVGFIAAYRFGQGYPLFLGIIGATVTLWATFCPCFLWIFAGAPYIVKLQNLPKLKGALDGVTAAVVGVILNLTVWFSLHVFFATVKKIMIGPIILWWPDPNTLDWTSIALAATAAVALLYFRLTLLWVLIITSCLALGWHLLTVHIV